MINKSSGIKYVFSELPLRYELYIGVMIRTPPKVGVISKGRKWTSENILEVTSQLLDIRGSPEETRWKGPPVSTMGIPKF